MTATSTPTLPTDKAEYTETLAAISDDLTATTSLTAEPAFMTTAASLFPSQVTAVPLPAEGSTVVNYGFIPTPNSNEPPLTNLTSTTSIYTDHESLQFTEVANEYLSGVSIPKHNYSDSVQTFTTEEQTTPSSNLNNFASVYQETSLQPPINNITTNSYYGFIPLDNRQTAYETVFEANYSTIIRGVTEEPRTLIITTPYDFSWVLQQGSWQRERGDSLIAHDSRIIQKTTAPPMTAGNSSTNNFSLILQPNDQQSNDKGVIGNNNLRMYQDVTKQPITINNTAATHDFSWVLRQEEQKPRTGSNLFDTNNFGVVQIVTHQLGTSSTTVYDFSRILQQENQQTASGNNTSVSEPQIIQRIFEPSTTASSTTNFDFSSLLQQGERQEIDEDGSSNYQEMNKKPKITDNIDVYNFSSVFQQEQTQPKNVRPLETTSLVDKVTSDNLSYITPQRTTIMGRTQTDLPVVDISWLTNSSQAQVLINAHKTTSAQRSDQTTAPSISYHPSFVDVDLTWLLNGTQESMVLSTYSAAGTSL